MTVRRSCPRCGKVGFIRAERVIKAGKGVTEFQCGACEHSWSESDDTGPAPATQEPTDDHA